MRYLTLKQAAEYLGWDHRMLSRWTTKGKIANTKVGVSLCIIGPSPLCQSGA